MGCWEGVAVGVLIECKISVYTEVYGGGVGEFVEFEENDDLVNKNRGYWSVLEEMQTQC